MSAAVAVTAALTGCVNGLSCDFDPCPPGTGTVAALDDTGVERWRTELSDRSDTAPLVAGDHVLVDGCRAVHVLDAATGRLLLSTEELHDTIGVAGGLVWGRAAEDGRPGRGLRGVALDGGPGREVLHASGTGRDDGQLARSAALSGDLVLGTAGDTLSTYPVAGGTGGWVQLPVVAQGRVLPVGDSHAVVGASDGSVVGVDLDPMALAWRVVPEQVSRAFDLRLAAHGDTVLVSARATSATSRVTEAFAVSVSDGSVLWRRREWELAVADGTVAVLVSPRAVTALDLRTGRELWSRRTAHGYTGSFSGVELDEDPDAVALSAGVAALPARTPRAEELLLGVEAATGRELWRVESERPAVGLAAAFGIRVGASPRAADDPRLLGATDARTGRQLWQHQLRAEQGGDPLPKEHLAADPARGHTIVLDLPRVPQGGCF